MEVNRNPLKAETALNIQSIKNSQVCLGIKRRANGLMEKVVSWTQIEDIDSIKSGKTLFTNSSYYSLLTLCLCVCLNSTKTINILKSDSFKDLVLQFFLNA